MQADNQLETEVNTLIMEACSYYMFEEMPIIEKGHSGMNNTTRMIRDKAALYSLRMYNNHQDEKKLQFEHFILNQLHHRKLALAVPLPVYNVNGSTITRLHNKKLVALFEYIEGERPTLHSSNHVRGLGRASGILSAALAELTIEIEPAYTPYYELATNYRPLTNEWKEELIARSDFIAACAKEIGLIQQERGKLEELAPQIALLPQQWIHGDINCSNALCRGEDIVAILDFEFVTKDVRAMELAVLLAELIKPSTEQLQSKLQIMMEAFVQEQPLTRIELMYLTELIKLRLIDVAMHFFHRFQDGLDEADILASIIANTAFGLSWLSAHPLQRKNDESGAKK